MASTIHNVRASSVLNAVGTRGHMQLPPTVTSSLGWFALLERAIFNEHAVAVTFFMIMHQVGHMESQLHTHNRAETTVDQCEYV